MKKEFRLPDVGEGLTEADIVSWHVKPGDTVTINQIIVDIETAKAVVELPSPYAGTVTAPARRRGADSRRRHPDHRGRRAWPGRRGDGNRAAREPGTRDHSPRDHSHAGPRGEGRADAGHAAAGARRLRRQAGLDEPPAKEEAADAARLLPGHPVRAADRRAVPAARLIPRGAQAAPRHSRPASVPRGVTRGDESGPTTATTGSALGAAGAVPGLRPGEGEMGEGLPRAWGGHRGGHPPGGK